MGRMLEVLGAAKTRPEPPAEAAGDPAGERQAFAAAASDAAGSGDSRDESAVSYIEVGGPRSVVDASPDVLASAPAASRPAGSVSPRPSVSSALATPIGDDDTAAITAPIAIWCSWTLRPGIKVEG
jgi:hypothetical protein